MIAADPVNIALERVASACRVRRLRTFTAFAEQEITLPSGPFEGERFKLERQPFARLWLSALDSAEAHGWRRFNLTGPSQAGKTLMGSALPVLYHIFECQENVIYAAPALEMCADKWREDILPLIGTSRYRDLLPERGDGSKGGTPTAIEFRNGATLRFMTGGGNDKTRAGFTARIVVITESDGLDEAAEKSREADPVSQLEARSNAYGDRSRLFLECTTSTTEGRTWTEHKAGTESRLALPCPHCRRFVTPEREHLVGWNDAATAAEAGQRAMLACPACGAGWTEPDRIAANRLARLVHRGQSVDESGTIVGLMPSTNTFSLRFSAANNLFTTMARVAAEEWTAQRHGDAALNDKKLRQFWWAMPSEAEAITLTEMDAMQICRRAIDSPRGRVPAGSVKLTVGVDVGKWLCHWCAVAWTADGTPHVAEYGRLETPSQSMAEEMAILTALRRFRDEICAPGWPTTEADAPNVRPCLSLIDSGNWESTVVAFVRESGAGYIAAKGFGIAQIGRRKLMHDPGYELVPQPAGHSLLEIQSDLWKSYVHSRLQTPAGQPGGLSIFHATPTEHLSFAKHLCAEKRVEEFIAGRGLVTRWEAVHRNNHYLDALALACVAGHGAGVRLVTTTAPQPPAPSVQAPAPRRERRVNQWIGDTSSWRNR